MASRFLTVSIKVSPLLILLAETDILIASALSRLAAISKDVRVLVEASKKRLMTVFPRSVGTFLMGRFEISRKEVAVAKINWICSIDRFSMLRRCLALNGTGPLWGVS